MSEQGWLIGKLNECPDRIGRMCSEVRTPSMSIPPSPNDDEFINLALVQAAARIAELEAVVEKLGGTASASLTTHCPVTGEHLHDVSEAHNSLANIVMQECEAALAAKGDNQ